MKMFGLNALVKEIEENKEKTTPGGLIIPETVALETSFVYADVISVGNGEVQYGTLVKPEFNVGDVVLIDKNYAKPIKVNNIDHLFVVARDVLAKKD